MVILVLLYFCSVRRLNPIGGILVTELLDQMQLHVDVTRTTHTPSSLRQAAKPEERAEFVGNSDFSFRLNFQTLLRKNTVVVVVYRAIYSCSGWNTSVVTPPSPSPSRWMQSHNGWLGPSVDVYKIVIKQVIGDKKIINS